MQRRARPISHHLSKYRFIQGLVSLLILLIVLILSAYQSHTHSDQLRVWMFDVGQGDAILIETPTGEQVLIDGGPDDAVLSKLGSVLWPWDHTLEAMILSHPDADHVSGLVGVLERYDVAQVIESGVRRHTHIDEAFVEAVSRERALHTFAKKGDQFVFGEVVLEVLHPDVATGLESNNASLVLRLTYKDTTILFTGDIEAKVEERISLSDIDVLKVAHHGSKTSSTEAFLRITRPEVALISVGVDNPFGHPSPSVLRHLKEQHVEIWRTDQEGTVRLTSDGDSYQVNPVFLPF